MYLDELWKSETCARMRTILVYYTSITLIVLWYWVNFQGGKEVSFGVGAELEENDFTEMYYSNGENIGMGCPMITSVCS